MISETVKRVLFLSIVFLFIGASTLLGEAYSHQVDTVISKMSVREKIAQLFIVAFNDKLNDKNTVEAIKLIEREKIGGLIIMDSPLTSGVEMINYMQSLSATPLLITLDGEWGVAMRLDSVLAFPRQMQMAALKDASLLFEVGAAIAKQTKRVGMHLNYAPTIDINNNPNNPVINTRAFGENREVVAEYGIAYLKGMQSNGIAGAPKHFPGHGDTDIDSHHGLPTLPFTRERLDSLELYPFKRAIKAGSDMIMVGHLDVPALDSSRTPSSISKPIITNLLREELGYDGIIVTDALNMKGVSEHLPKEQLPLEAFKAGCDIILMPENVFKSIDIMERAVESGEISIESIDNSVRKMLTLKAKLNLLSPVEPVSLTNLHRDLNSQKYRSLISQICENSLTLIKNSNNMLPLKDLSDKRVGYLSLGGDNFGTEFGELLLKYNDADTVILRGKYSLEQLSESLQQLSDSDYTIIAMHNTDARPHMEFGIDNEVMEMITSYSREKSVIFIYFGNPLAIPYLQNHHNFSSFLLAYQNSYYNNVAAVHKIFGATKVMGRLPVTSGEYNFNHSITTNEVIRFAHRVPLEIAEGFDTLTDSIESLLSNDIDSRYSNAQVLLFNSGSILYDKRVGDSTNSEYIKLGRISNILTLIPSIMILKEMALLSLEEMVDGVLISDLLMHRDSRDAGSIEPHYNQENVKKLITLIESRTGERFIDFSREKIFEPLGISRFKVIDDDIYADAIELSKVLAMLSFGGEYGGSKIMSKAAAKEALLYLSYYSKEENGNIVWVDSDGKSGGVFINDGADYVTTGEFIRHLSIDF